MANRTSFKTPLLYGVIVSVLVGAFLGVFFVVRGTWDWFEVQVILTTVVIAGASLCGLASDMARIPSGWNLLPKVGLVLSCAGGVMLLFGIWGSGGSVIYWKSTLCILILGVATVHVCLLSIARVVQRFQWVQFVATQCVFGLAALLCVVCIGEIESEPLWRMVAVVSILVAALSMTIPILHRISKMDPNRDELRTPLEARNVLMVDEEILRLERRLNELQRVRRSLVAASSPSLCECGANEEAGAVDRTDNI